MFFKIFCALLLWTVGLCLSSATAEDFDKMTPGKSSSCNYLDIEGNQNNSYTFEGRVCCMCGKGRKFVDHCNVFNPSTTRCDPCEYDENDPSKRTHIEFEPHLEESCVKKKKRHCHDGKEYFGGSITEADGCRCPDGMVDDTNGVRCHSVAVTVKPELQDFSSTSKPSTSDANTNLVVRIKATAETTVSTKTSKSKPPDQDQPLTITHLIPWIALGVVAVIVICLVIFFVCCRHRLGNFGYKRGQSAESTPNPQRNTNVAITDSSTTFSTNESSASLPSSRNGRNSTRTTGNGRNQPPIRMTDSPSSRSTSANTYTGHVVVDLSSEAIRETSSPVERNSRHIAVESSLNVTHHNNLSSSSGVENAADMPETIQRPVISIEEANSLINANEAKVIATAFAKRFGYEGNRRYVLPLMRDLASKEDETIPDESVAFDDLDNKYKNNTPEFCVQCMRHVIAVKGNGLTAKYLLKKVENLRMKTYENIVIDEINKTINANSRPSSQRYLLEPR